MYDPLISKRQQYLLATQLVRAVLKIGSSPCFHPTTGSTAPYLSLRRRDHDRTLNRRIIKKCLHEMHERVDLQWGVPETRGSIGRAAVAIESTR